MGVLVSRFANRVQLISDGHRDYLEMVKGGFGYDVDNAHLVKMYGATATAAGRYNPAECIDINSIQRECNADTDQISTAYSER